MDEIHKPQHELRYLSESEMRNDVEDCSAKAAASQAGITSSFAVVCEKVDASLAFVDSLITKGELASLKQETVDVQRESEQLRLKQCLSDSLIKAFCQDFPDKLIKRINTMVVELTAEYFDIADDSDGTGLKNGQSLGRRAIYPMNLTKAVPDMGSEGSLMPSSYENTVALRGDDHGQAATAASLHPPHLLRPPVLLGSPPHQQSTALHVASTDCQQPIEFLRHSTLTFALPPAACMKGQQASDATDASHDIKDWIQSKVYVLYIVFFL